jgi:hypothetical protein
MDSCSASDVVVLGQSAFLKSRSCYVAGPLEKQRPMGTLNKTSICDLNKLPVVDFLLVRRCR